VSAYALTSEYSLRSHSIGLDRLLSTWLDSSAQAEERSKRPVEAAGPCGRQTRTRRPQGAWTPAPRPPAPTATTGPAPSDKPSGPSALDRFRRATDRRRGYCHGCGLRGALPKTRADDLAEQAEKARRTSLLW